MTLSGPNLAHQPMVSNTGVALTIYILNFANYFFTGLPSIVGVIMAHVQVGNADPVLATHYRFQIRTFWIGLLYVVGGGAVLTIVFVRTLLALIFVGLLVLSWWFIWSLIRNIRGVLALNECRTVPNPASWLFG
jgi:uncharacterized membrane protein